MKNIAAQWCGMGVVCLWSLMLGATTTTPQIAGIHCLKDRSVVYLPDSIAQTYAKITGALSEQKMRSHSRQYAVAGTADDFVSGVHKSVISKQKAKATTITMRDGARFLVPTELLTRIGAKVTTKKVVETDARSLRPYLAMLLNIASDLCGAADHLVCAQVVRQHLDKVNLSCSRIRALRRVGWALDVDDWIDRVFEEFDTASRSSGSSCSSVTSSTATEMSGTTGSERSDLSFVSEVDAAGVRRKRYDIAQCIFDFGVRPLMDRMKDGVFDMRELGLTSIHDLSVISGAFTREERNAVTTLDLSGNDLQEIPGHTLWHFPQLKTLIVKNNVHLKRIDKDAFIWMSHLQAVDFGSCDLEALPVTVFNHVPTLKVIILEYNRLRALPQMKMLKQLEMLSVHHNKLERFPDISEMGYLEVINAAYNRLPEARASLLPVAGSLTCVLFNDNEMSSLSSGFLHRLPQKGMVNLSNNPMWAGDNLTNTNKLLASRGYEQLPNEARRQADSMSNQVRDAIFADVRDKLFDYLIDNKLIKAKVLRDEICGKRPLCNIHTRTVDVGMWFYRYGGWFVMGASLIFGGVGSLVGFMLKRLGATALKRAAIGGVVGLAVGAVAGYIGYNTWYDKRNFYLSSGGQNVYMTSELRGQYIGTFRLISLFALLKQYLVACNACLYWALNYDELAVETEKVRLDVIMDRFQDALHLRAEQIIARTSDATCIGMITQLVADNPLTELKRHCPDDLFPASDMASQPLAEKATYHFMGIEKLTMVRGVICRFAKVARIVRAMLMNRYLGNTDHCGMLKLVPMVEPLKEALNITVGDILETTILSMFSVGHKGQEWYTEMLNLRRIAKSTQDLLDHLEKRAKKYGELAAAGGIQR